MNSEKIIRDAATLLEAQQWLTGLFNSLGWIRISYATKKRKLSSNALSHVWYTELAKQRGDYSAAQYKCLCKLAHGVPILLRDSEKFRNFWERFFRFLSYEEQLASMKYISVSSLFSQVQFNEYLNEIVKHYAPEGVRLTSHKEAGL